MGDSTIESTNGSYSPLKAAESMAILFPFQRRIGQRGKLSRASSIVLIVAIDRNFSSLIPCGLPRLTGLPVDTLPFTLKCMVQPVKNAVIITRESVNAPCHHRQSVNGYSIIHPIEGLAKIDCQCQQRCRATDMVRLIH